MTWTQFENKEGNAIEGPSHQFGNWFYFGNPVTTAQLIKAADPSSECDTTVHLYTDGSSKGANFCQRDEKSFSGWGCQMVIKTPHSTKEMTFNGGIFNADSNTAELSAVLQSLIRISGPCNVHIHSDSQYVISALADLPSFIKNRRAAIEAYPESTRSRIERNEYQRLGLWERVQTELNKNLIQNVTIQWIKAHQLSDLNPNRNKIDPSLLQDIKGNDMADRLSNIGVITGIVHALHDLEKMLRYNPQKAELQCRIMTKNFATSYFSRETAIMYLVEKPKLLTPAIISRILDTESSTRIKNAIECGIAVKPNHPQLNNALNSTQSPDANKGKNRQYVSASPNP
jgi:ribonuclease HI